MPHIETTQMTASQFKPAPLEYKSSDLSAGFVRMQLLVNGQATTQRPASDELKLAERNRPVMAGLRVDRNPKSNSQGTIGA